MYMLARAGDVSGRERDNPVKDSDLGSMGPSMSHGER